MCVGRNIRAAFVTRLLVIQGDMWAGLDGSWSRVSGLQPPRVSS
jgi:hypothetical protein